MTPGRAFLTQNDVQNYGSDLVDFAQRAAIHATAPQLQALDQQNAELERQLAVERRKRLDQEVEAAVPNYREIDVDPRWLVWLRQIEPLNGRPRQHLLDEAAAAGSATRVIAFFKNFLAEVAVGQVRTPRRHAPVSRDLNDRSKSLTRAQIAEFYSLHRRGKLVGPEWEQIEQQIIAAGAEGRVIGPLDPHGK